MAEPMAGGGPIGVEAEFGPLRTVGVALAVCGVCALLLTGSVVLLRPYQIQNQQDSSEARVHELVSDLPGVGALIAEAGEAQLDLRAVELATGVFAPSVDPMDLLEGGDGGAESTPLPAERDPAGIGRVPRYAPVHLLYRAGSLHTVILPVSGRGYGGAIRGYLALAGDGDTVRGITFVDHRETPGLGAEIESADWQARWRGKRLRDAGGAVRIRTVELAPDPNSPDSVYEIQGISGATRTSRGVAELVRFWVGPDGFGPLLTRLRAGEDA